MAKERDVLNECGHRNSERVEALKELPSSVCPACLLKRIEELEKRIATLHRQNNSLYNTNQSTYTKLKEVQERIKELEGVMVIIQSESSDGLATMKNEERPDIQRILRRTFSLVSGCQIVSKP